MMKSSEYRTLARANLKGQWGKFALVMLISILLSNFITQLFVSFLGERYPWIGTFVGIFLTFAFNYGLFYTSLIVSRGQKIKMNMIFSGFNDGRYVPLLIIHCLERFVSFVISVIVALPFVSILGIGIVSSVFVSNNINAVTELVANGGFSALVLLSVMFIGLILGISTLIDGFFQIIVLMRLDYPKLKLKGLIQSSLALLKGKWWELFLLQLSFIGWYLLGIFVLPLLWITPYRLVAIAQFYEETKEEFLSNEVKKTNQSAL